MEGFVWAFVIGWRCLYVDQLCVDRTRERQRRQQTKPIDVQRDEQMGCLGEEAFCIVSRRVGALLVFTC